MREPAFALEEDFPDSFDFLALPALAPVAAAAPEEDVALRDPRLIALSEPLATEAFAASTHQPLETLAAAVTISVAAAPEALAGVASDGPADAPDALEAMRLKATFSAISAKAARFDAGAFTGKGKAVVVIDDGFSWRYDQKATVYAFDFSGRNDPVASGWSLNSHGSWVAQTALKAAPGINVIHLKVFPDGGGGASIFDIEEALQWVVRNAKAWDVAAVNLSLGFGNTARDTRTILSDEFAALDRIGVVSVVAAGNAHNPRAHGVNVLAADPSVVAVSATDSLDRFASFSQRHPGQTDIAALGVGVGVQTIDGLRGFVSGTSFAAPYVSGAVAVLQEASEVVLGRSLSRGEVTHILQASGDAVRGAPKAPGYKVADVDAAVDYFLANAASFAQADWVA
jgi:hypothetical protein